MADLPYAAKYPVILPSIKVNAISGIIVKYFHEVNGHQGRSATISSMRAQGLWILGSSTHVSTVLKNCMHCKKLYGLLQSQHMADLPEVRVTPSPPFTFVGTDLFGPFWVREGRKSLKRYGVIFVCMSSRAIHLEVTHSLSTDAFISTLRRLIALRGSVRKLFCDKGTNFVGAEAELKQAVKELSKEKISDFLLKNNCDYSHFACHVPHASHFGGLWERNIRTARRILASLLRDQGGQLNDEALRTLFYEIAALMNSKPYSFTPNDEDLAAPLCPQNLLTTKSGIVLPPPGRFEAADSYSKKYWRRIQYMADQFWLRWQKSCLQEMQSRQKWNQPKSNLGVGDVVIIKDELTPRGNWNLGIIEKTYPSSDDKIRSVRVRVGDRNLNKEGKRVKATSYLDRPIHKLILITKKQSS